MIKFTTVFLLISYFSLALFSQSIMTPLTLTDKEVTTTSYTDKDVVINGKTDLHLTATDNPLINSRINLNSEDSWVFFDNIRPNTVISSYLSSIVINSQAAVQNTNVRIAIYKQGTVVIPQSSSYQPLEVFTGKNFTESSAKYSLYNMYTNLGAFDNRIKSFKLKRGYMATLATNSDGTGYSRVYIAEKEDLLVPEIPLLEGTISFIRVMNWEWVSKKGWCQTGSASLPAADKVKATWFYSWSADQTSSNTLEYVPIRQNGGWPGWTEINGKQRVSHVLGFNEPDHTEQSNLTVSQALAQWPDMMRTGLRIGSPACTSTSWLYQFIDSCDAHNYRVDYVAWHAYWGGKSPINWYNDLKALHERTKRPIWITEWNNGANWTTETWPDDSKALTPSNAQKQLNDLTNILQVLDTARFIERYSIYNWVQDCRAMILADTLTPAGKYYASDHSQIAFDRTNEVIPGWSFSNPVLNVTINNSNVVSFGYTDKNGEFNKGYKIEKQINNGAYAKVKDTVGTTHVQYTDNVDISLQKVRYRVRTNLPDGAETGNSNDAGYDVTEGSTIQTGRFSFGNVGWNNIYFKQPYDTIPVIIFGSPTNNNGSVLLSCRAKQTDLNRFMFQLAPWAYQNVTTLTKEESVPYVILKEGNYHFGELMARAGKVYVNQAWTQITFPIPFDTIPVVLVTQLTASASNATGVRIKNVTKTGFMARLQKESKVTSTLYRETVSYLAITPGKGTMNGKNISVGRTVNAPVNTSILADCSYGDTYTNPLFIGQMQTCNDDTVTATLRCSSIFSTYARVFKQREKSLGFTNAAFEDAGWLVFDQADISNGIFHAKTKTDLKIMPNPATDVLYFSEPFTKSVRVNIYTLNGKLVKSEIISGDRINVSDLKPGYYMLNTADAVTKFIKL